MTNFVRPPGVPEKFWDKERGALRLDALLKSYRELERRFSQRGGEPRPPWKVLREAARISADPDNSAIMLVPGIVPDFLAKLADHLEADARPKPPTLAEAVRAWFEKPSFSRTEAMKEALARAEAGQ